MINWIIFLIIIIHIFYKKILKSGKSIIKINKLQGRRIHRDLY